jgi:hypothetical protein
MSENKERIFFGSLEAKEKERLEGKVWLDNQFLLHLILFIFTIDASSNYFYDICSI